ncbi:MAG: radical SAM protein [Chloroflexi bacterium]|nr:radical SAM protein [Chloroflexota bacterium]
MNTQTTRLANDNYQPLSPYKFLHHPDRLAQFWEHCYDVTPVTAHLAPTLYCNQRCYFCTYGQYKEHGKNSMWQMDIRDLKDCLDQLAENGIKGVIFTGGGEPTIYPHLVEAMAHARSLGLDIALNTNGYRCSDALLDGILLCQPRYIRVSFNNGRALTQRLVTGRDNFQQVLDHIARMAERKASLSPATDLSVGYVVNTVNVHEMLDFLRHILGIEASVRRKTGVANPIYSVQFRPVSNFEHSKYVADEERLARLAAYLGEQYGQAYRDELEGFLFQGQQASVATMQLALETIQTQLVPALAQDGASKIKIVYPERKYTDLIARAEKPYPLCLSCPWYLFIWPDGNLYSCVEWAGNPQFAIGNILRERLADVLAGPARREMADKINQGYLHHKCVAVCAHHEMNILLNRLYADGREKADGNLGDVTVRHENFL